jgi:hypothetical protein
MKKLLPIYILVLLFSCKNDDEIICDNDNTPCENPIPQTIFEVDTCFDLSYDVFGNLPLYPLEARYLSPIFNPTIEGEFVFVRFKPNDWRIYKTNLCNEYYQEGFDMATLASPILLDMNQGEELIIKSFNKFYKVNFDGSDLKEIKNDSYTFKGLQWCCQDTLLYGIIESDDVNSPFYQGKAGLINIDGEIIIDFPKGIGNLLAVPRKNKILTFASINNLFHFGYIDLTTNNFHSIQEIILPSQDGFYISNFRWINDSDILLIKSKSNHQKLYKMNIVSLEMTLIDEINCENHGFGVFSHSPFDETQTLFQYQEYKSESSSSDSLHYLSYIVKKNISTGEEYILDINF